MKFRDPEWMKRQTAAIQRVEEAFEQLKRTHANEDRAAAREAVLQLSRSVEDLNALYEE